MFNFYIGVKRYKYNKVCRNIFLQPDEVERSVKEVNKLLGESHMPKISATCALNAKHDRNAFNKTILSVQHKHLNPNNELKRIFGSKIIQAEQ